MSTAGPSTAQSYTPHQGYSIMDRAPYPDDSELLSDSNMDRGMEDYDGVADEQRGLADESTEVNEDPSLKIRIPNPSTYTDRQNNWVGRRGKPRCDFCRANNLKCDRVLPACNHCLFQKKDCSYTPLPTPAHRGIPRCDRCRTLNFKCDRALPTCNYCIEGQVAQCHYSSKRRHKNPEMALSEANPGATYQFSSFSATPPIQMEVEKPAEQVVQVVPSPPNQREPPRYRDDNPNDPTRHYRRPGNPKPHFESWAHGAFPALPGEIILRLSDINPNEIPTREAFDEVLNNFIANLSPELRETAVFSINMYTAISASLNQTSGQPISTRVNTWIMAHRAVSGSALRSLILLPTDQVFHLDNAELDTYRQQYVAQVDAKTAAMSAKLLEQSLDCLKSFDRLPVMNQIYDILASAHWPGHKDPFTMLKEARARRMAGITWPMAEMFVRLCPTCIARREKDL